MPLDAGRCRPKSVAGPVPDTTRVVPCLPRIQAQELGQTQLTGLPIAPTLLTVGWCQHNTRTRTDKPRQCKPAGSSCMWLLPNASSTPNHACTHTAVAQVTPSKGTNMHAFPECISRGRTSDLAVFLGLPLGLTPARLPDSTDCPTTHKRAELLRAGSRTVLQ